MDAPNLLAAAIVGLVLVGGVAAVGAAVPTDEPNGDDDDVDPANASERVDTAGDRPGAVGPDGGLPAHAPEFVSDIHDTIGSFLDGSIDHVGDSLGTLLSAETPAEAGTWITEPRPTTARCPSSNDQIHRPTPS